MLREGMRPARQFAVVTVALLVSVLAVSLAAQTPPPAAGRAQRPAAAPQVAPAKSPLAGFDADVARMMANWKVPGVAIAIVKDGQVLLSKGYGLRDVANNLPVTPTTIFPIASITKSFTVATLATLAAEGKLDWDKPVRDLLPEFRLADDGLTARVTVRDLVTHRTGLPRHDATWYHVEMPRADLVGLLRHLQPSRDLRQTFQYNNLMFLTAGYLAGKLAGSTWEDAVRARIFGPLGMRSSNFSVDDSKRSSDWAHAYQKDDQEQVREVPLLKADDVGPAGSINSTLEDMTRYLRMYLDGGRHEGRPIVGRPDVAQMMSPQMIIPSSGLDPELGFNHYGMGLFVTSYRGRTFVHHGGNLDGFSLLISFLPEINAGAVVLTNMNGSSLREVLTYGICDRLLGLDPIDWDQRLMGRYLAGKKAEADALARNYVPRVTGTRPGHAMDQYVGEYTHPAYGTIVVSRAAKETDLGIAYHGFASTAIHWHYEQWRVPQDALDRLERTHLQFNTDRQGLVRSVSVPMEPAVADIEFVRQPDRRMRERGFLEPLAGTYRLGSVTLVVALRDDNVLTYTTPSGAVYRLEPVQELTFAIAGMNGGAIDFKKDASGAVVEFALTTPGGTSLATRVK